MRREGLRGGIDCKWHRIERHGELIEERALVWARVIVGHEEYARRGAIRARLNRNPFKVVDMVERVEELCKQLSSESSTGDNGRVDGSGRDEPQADAVP